MDATPINEHVNPLKKLREVLMTCGRDRTAELCGNEWKIVREMEFVLNNIPLAASFSCQPVILSKKTDKSVGLVFTLLF